MKPWINFKAFRDERRHWDKCLLSFVEWGENMLTNFLMASPGGLDFCLANVFLECISVFSYSCPASYQRPACVCVFRRKMQCVCGQCVCLPLTGCKLDSAQRQDATCRWRWRSTLREMTGLGTLWKKHGRRLTYRIGYVATFPVFLTMRVIVNSFQMCPSPQQTFERIHLHQPPEWSGKTSWAAQCSQPLKCPYVLKRPSYYYKQ